MNESKIDFSTYMRGLCNAPWDNSKCGDCGGTGLTPEMCCSGRECGCHGKPIDFTECHCETTPPTDAQIKIWCDESLLIKEKELKMNNREAHEKAAGMGLEDSFFKHNGIDPDAEAQELTVDTAAVKDNTGKIWTLPRPYRHDDVEDIALEEGARGLEKGFVLSDETFATRKEAETVARESGQKKGNLVHPHLGGLSSDDLW